MNGERCRDANLPFEPSMSRADGALAIAIIECATVNCTIVERIILCDESIIRAFDEVCRRSPFDFKNWTRNLRLYPNLFLAERSQNGQYFQRRQAKRSPDCRRPAVWHVGDPFTEANPWAVRLKCAWQW